MTTKRLTTVESRAQRWCQAIIRNEGMQFVVEWRKSRQWGSNPVIEHNGEKICSVSGCGYCKLSTALAYTLCFLFPVEGSEFNAVQCMAGAGVSSVQKALADRGWILEQGQSGKTFDRFTIRREST